MDNRKVRLLSRLNVLLERITRGFSLKTLGARISVPWAHQKWLLARASADTSTPRQLLGTFALTLTTVGRTRAGSREPARIG